MRFALLTASALILSTVFCAEDPVNVFTFELSDGSGGKRTVAVQRYSALGNTDLKSYIATTLDGKKIIFLEKDILSRKEEWVPFEKLPEPVRQEISKSRAAAAASRAEAEAYAAEQKAIAAFKRKENDARAALNKATQDLAQSQTLLANAELIVRNAPIEIARVDAHYDAARTELAGMSSGGGGYVIAAYSSYNPRRAEYLRQEMAQAAEDKARLEISKKEAEGVIKRVQEAQNILALRVDSARKELQDAQAETQKAILKLRAEREQKKADVGDPDELIIGRAVVK